MNEYQQRNNQTAQDLATEFNTLLAFKACEVIQKEDNANEFDVIMTIKGKQFKVWRDYQQNIHITTREWYIPQKVSSSVRGEVAKKYKLENMKVPTLKKIDARIQACLKECEELQQLEKDAREKRDAFLFEFSEKCKKMNVKPLYTRNYEYRTNKNGVYERYDTDIVSGEVVHNGIEFTFTLHDDGYISKKISIHYTVTNTLESFEALSSNSFVQVKD